MIAEEFMEKRIAFIALYVWGLLKPLIHGDVFVDVKKL